MGGGGSVVFHNQGSTFFTVGNMGVMICLCQGGLSSLSASSFKFILGFLFYHPFFTSLAKEVMSLVAFVCLFVCLSVCLSVCGQHYSKSYERIGMKFYGWVLGSTMKN